ncbi:hypothetical protein BCR39DRAFT_47721 [Naematelia encephala]|uniref:Uncharacterized protein n=1 Tax=Naematelia encephala TaxID=71784 RepID=A0A1Y2AJ64_9TREE|nr:hypothetical protein BCR39DRAFT_47721 [Naematelia encephala]
MLLLPGSHSYTLVCCYIPIPLRLELSTRKSPVFIFLLESRFNPVKSLSLPTASMTSISHEPFKYCRSKAKSLPPKQCSPLKTPSGLSNYKKTQSYDQVFEPTSIPLRFVEHRTTTPTQAQLLKDRMPNVQSDSSSRSSRPDFFDVEGIVTDDVIFMALGSAERKRDGHLASVSGWQFEPDGVESIFSCGVHDLEIEAFYKIRNQKPEL